MFKRIYTRVFCLLKKLDFSDYLLVAAALDALGLIICDTLTFKMGVMDDYEPSEKLFKVCFPLHLSAEFEFRLFFCDTFTSSVSD